MRCKRCGEQMVKTKHFEKEKNYQYFFCKKCFFKTRNKSIDYKEGEKNDYNS